ncbi:unnamed protein product, partial [Polarella glacialis]
MGICASTAKPEWPASPKRSGSPKRARAPVARLRVLLRPDAEWGQDDDVHRLVVAEAARWLDGAVISQPAAQTLLGRTANRPSHSPKKFHLGTEVMEERPAKALSESVGFACVKGHKVDDPCQPNQDHFIIAQTYRSAVYGVFDGHGPLGHLLASYAASKILEYTLSSEHFQEHPLMAMSAAFAQTQLDCEYQRHLNMLDCSVSGTSAIVLIDCPKHVAWREHRTLFLAHIGDCRAVLGLAARGLLKGKLVAQDLTFEHKPSMMGERFRIMEAGGIVRKTGGDDTHECVFVKDKLYPALATSRSIGDSVAHTIGVTAKPDVKVLIVEEGWNFVLLCTDGVWDVMTSQEAVEVIELWLRTAPK